MAEPSPTAGRQVGPSRRETFDLDAIGWMVSDIRAQLNDRPALHPTLRPRAGSGGRVMLPTSHPATDLILDARATAEVLIVRLSLVDGTDVGRHRWLWADVCPKCQGARYVLDSRGRPEMCPVCQGSGRESEG